MPIATGACIEPRRKAHGGKKLSQSQGLTGVPT